MTDQDVYFVLGVTVLAVILYWIAELYLFMGDTRR